MLCPEGRVGVFQAGKEKEEHTKHGLRQRAVKKHDCESTSLF